MIDPVLIDPEALYDDAALRQALGLTPATLAASRRAGTLRHTRTGKRTLYKGAWILAWLEAEAKPCRIASATQPEGEDRQGRAR